MTGDTANGRSISVIKMFLPRNSNLVIAQAALTPKTVLIGTATAAVRKGQSYSGQGIRLGKRTQVHADPAAERGQNISSSGMTSTSIRNDRASLIRIARTRGDSVRAARTLGCRRASVIVLPPATL